MARHCFHEPQTQEPGCAHWYLPTPATASLGPAQSSLQGPGSRHWAHKISQWPAMAKPRNAATVLGCKSRQEERCSPRTETHSHPIKLAVFDTPNLTASWEEASVRSLLGRAVSAHAGNSTHRKALSQRKWGLCNGSSATFYNKVNGSCTGENSLGEKISSGQLLAFLTINLFKATDWEDLRTLLKIRTENWLLHSEFVSLPSCS